MESLVLVVKVIIIFLVVVQTIVLHVIVVVELIVFRQVRFFAHGKSSAIGR
jgi:hypothetical protein